MKWEPISGLGQDNDYIYKDVLGFSDEEYAKAQSEGHIASAYLKPDGTSV